MNDFILYPLYIVLGLLGGSGHYLKKRYVDDTTKDNFFHYLSVDFTSTKKAALTIICSSIGIAVNHIDPVSMQELFSILTAGYMADSVFNKDSGD